MTERVLFETREEWLSAAADTLRGAFRSRAGIVVPAVRVGVGFPSTGLRSNVAGQTWKRAASRDNVNEITIRVTLDNPVEVLAVLGHELIHASFDCVGGHGKRFTAAASACGYVGDPKTASLSEPLRENMAALAEALGAYPGDSGLAVAAQAKKQGTRMLKCVCSACGFTFRTTAKWIEGRALICPDENCQMAVSVETHTDGEGA